MNKKEQIKSLLESIKLTGNVQSDSLKDFSEGERELIMELYNEDLVDQALDVLDNLDTDRDWDTLLGKISKRKSKVLPGWKRFTGYAAAVFCICVVLYFAFDQKQIRNVDAEITGIIKLKTGEDGIKIIEEGESQQIISKKGQLLGTQNGNSISYKQASEIDELIYSELEIPYGKIFDLEFSDGTVVHLNSGTKIRYPVRFPKDGNRDVFIEGEAYFKVTKDKEHPFVVHTDEVAIKVLGTEFNVSSYKEDLDIGAVLVEGSISMSSSNDDEHNILLQPGEKGTWDKANNTTLIDQVDVSLYTGWINGELLFRDTPFDIMAKKLERKYGVEIINFNTTLEDRKLNARFHKEIESIDDVMKYISEIANFKYRITDGKVIIQ